MRQLFAWPKRNLYCRLFHRWRPMLTRYGDERTDCWACRDAW